MSIKKLKVIFSFALFFLLAGTITACGGDKGTVVFKQTSLTMGINQEIDLNELVELTGCNIENISFVSSDSSVVYVTPSKKLISRKAGVGIITVDGYEGVVLEITVRGTSLKFDSPNALAYDETKSSIVWEAMYAGNTVATTYEVTITKDGGEPITEVVNTTSYEILDAGNYSVQVACMEREGIQKSEPTKAYAFTKLGAPTSLSYDDETSKLTWSANVSAGAFRVFVNGVSSEIITGKEYSLNLTDPKKYEITVMTCASENQKNVFGAMSNSLTLTRLKSPELSINEGVITWEDASLSAEKFNVTITGTATTNQTIAKNSAGKYSFALSGVDAGTYGITVTAIGNGENNVFGEGAYYLNSASATIENVEKLNTKQLSFDKLNKKIKVVDFETGLKLLLTIDNNGEKNTVDISETGEYEYDFASAGEYKFTLLSAPQTNLQINSDISGEITVVKLNNVLVANHLVQDNKYFVNGYSVENATNYIVNVINGENKTTLTAETNNITTLFKDAGVYNVDIIAQGTDNLDDKVYYLESETRTKLTVTRLAIVSLDNDKDHKQIVWDSVSNIGNLRYAYELSGMANENGILETNEYSYSGLGVGSYEISVWATVSEQVGTQNIVLDSKEKSKIDFVVDETLASPKLSWSEGVDNGVEQQYINIENVPNATHYEVYCNGSPIKLENVTLAQSTTINVTSYLSNAGEYTFTVKAVNKESGEYYPDSPMSLELKAIRLEKLELENVDGLKITWNEINEYDNVVYSYELKGPKNELGLLPDKAQDSITDCEVIYSSFEAGEYCIYVWVGVTSNSGNTIILDSDKSEKTFEVYEELDSPNLAWQQEDGKQLIKIEKVKNATNYPIYLNSSTTPLNIEIIDNTDYLTYDVSEFVKSAGTYTFKVKARNENNKYYTESAENTLTAIRLENCSLTNNSLQSAITWNEISGATYGYELFGPMGTDLSYPKRDSGTLDINIYNYEELGAGEYLLHIWASATSNNVKTLMLDSEEKSEITFEVRKVIETPVLSWNKVIDSQTNNVSYKLSIKNTLGVDSYDIMCNLGEVENIKALGETTTYDVTKFITDNVSEFVFTVTPKGAVGGYYDDGNPASLTVKKIDAPHKFNFTLNPQTNQETVTSTISSNYYNGTEILVKSNLDSDYNKTNILDSSANEFVVRIKYFAVDGKVDNCYYIDSNYEEFNLKRISTKISINANILSWEYDDYSLSGQTFETKVIAEIEGQNLQIPSTYLTGNSLDLSNLVNNYPEIQSAKISLQLVANNFEGNNTEIIYFATSKQNSINLIKAGQENIGLSVVEHDNKVTIDWTKNGEATYKLNGDTVTQFASSDFTNETKFFSIEEKLNDQVNVYVFTITRLGNVERILIDEEENVTSNSTLPTGAQKIEITLDGVIVNSLSSVTVDNVGQVLASYKAIASESFSYYLDGESSLFKFKRLNSLSNVNLNVSNDWLIWTLEETLETILNKDAYQYRLIFSNSEKETVEKLINIQTLSVNLMSDEYSALVHNGFTFVRVQKVIGEFTAKANESGIYYLSSEDSESNNKTLKVLKAPDNIYINSVGDDYAQSQIQISWDWNDGNQNPAEYQAGANLIKVFKENSQEGLIETDGFYNVLNTETFFKGYGKWGVSLRVKGQGDTISSAFSEKVQIDRLANSARLSLSADGIMNWQAVENANGYVLTYSYTKYDNEVITKTLTNISSLAIGEVEYVEFVKDGNFYIYDGINKTLSEEFYGSIAVTIYAIGSGSSALSPATLSSVKEVTNLKRLERVQAEFNELNITITNFDSYTSNETIHIEPYLEGVKLASYTIAVPAVPAQEYSWTYPTFKAQDGTIITFDEQKEILFKIYVTSNSSNTINSNEITQSVIKLANVSNLRFVRESGIIKFKVDNINTNGQTYVDIGGNTFISEHDAANNNLVIEIGQDILAGISGNWTIITYAKGDIDGDTIYINGETSTISGTSLSIVNSIYVDDTNTKVLWDTISGATSYILKVYNLDTPETIIYETKTIQQAEEIMNDYVAGEYNFSIQAIGNIGDEEISQNVVFDSRYSAEQLITKLESITNVNVELGYITLNEVIGADALIVSLFETIDGQVVQEYELNKPSDDATYYTNTDLIEKLKDGKEYYARFYAKATKEAYISSDYAEITDLNNFKENYMVIRLFDKTDNVVTLSHPYLNYIDENNYTFDYATTIATFKTNGVIEDGILLSVDGKVESRDKNNLSLTLDINGDWTVGQHYIKYAQYGSSGVASNRVVYLTEFGDTTTVTKLSAPVLQIKQRENAFTSFTIGEQEVNLFENYLTFTTDYSDGMYYLYKDGSDSFFKSYDKAVSEVELNGLTAGDYSELSMKFVSKKLGYLASNRAFLKDGDGNNLTLRKLEVRDIITKQVTIQNGDMIIKMVNGISTKEATGDDCGTFDGAFGLDATNDISDILNLYLSISSGSINLADPSLILNQYVDLQFIDAKTNALVKQKYTNLLSLIIGSYNLFFEQISVKGFPTLDYGFLDTLKDLPGGEYKIRLRTMGSYDKEGVYMFTSDYCEAKTLYISGAPKIRVESVPGKTINSKIDDEYELKFNNILVNTNYFKNKDALVYELVGLYKDENGNEVRKTLATKSPNGINTNEEISFNLSQLIESGILTTDYTELCVYVKGNTANKVINGKFSNKVTIKTLEEIVARVDHGVIKWAHQENASKYVISYKGSEDAYELIVNSKAGTTEYEWTCGELAEEKPYEIKIMAYGTEGVYGASIEKAILSGPITNLGKVTKLESIKSFDVINGLFVWDKKENAVGYDVFINNNEVTDDNYGAYTEVTNYGGDVNKVYYETTVEDGNVYYYYFRAFGDTCELNKDSSVFVNSDISGNNIGKRIDSVENIAFEDGNLTWTAKNDTAFRLTFTKDGVNIVINLFENNKNGFKRLAGNKYEFNLNAFEDLMSSGEYIVDIQQYYIENTSAEEGSYLISSPVEKDFYKLERVEDITISNGVVSWNYNGKFDNNYHFDLVFKYIQDNIPKTKTITVPFDAKAGGNYNYCDAVFEDDDSSNISTQEISLVIYVVPGSDDKNHATSAPVAGPIDNNGSIVTIRQVDKISEENNDIIISITDNKLKIDWVDMSDCEYEIEYYTIKDGIESEVNYISNITESEYIWGSTPDSPQFDMDGEYILAIRIRAIPLTDNYLTSVWTDVQEIQKPSEVTGLKYNSETYEFTWDQYGAGNNSLKYLILDEIGLIDEDGNFVVKTAYLFESDRMEDTKYIPDILGIHRVSVAVMVNNGTSDLMSEYEYVREGDEIVLADTTELFDGGAGTENDPYQIVNETQFNNMKYRLSKDPKNNRYYECDVIDGQVFVGETAISVESTIYYFKQMNELNITKDYALTDHAGVENTIVFNGLYDGNYNALTLVWNEDVTQNEIDSDVYSISLFKTIGPRGIVQNINLQMDIEKIDANGLVQSITIEKNIIISGIAINNYGTIQNIIIGKFDDKEIKFEGISQNFALSYIAYNNGSDDGENIKSAKISQVQNYYNTNISSKDSGYGSADCYLGAISIYNLNNAVVTRVKNFGNMYVASPKVYIGGLIVSMYNNAQLTESANVGNIEVYLRSSSDSYIGGLVAMADTPKIISNVYVIGDITICSPKSISVDNVCAGGLIGSAKSITINYAYVNITRNAKQTSNNYNYANKIPQLIYKLTNVNNDNIKNVYYKDITGDTDDSDTSDAILYGDMYNIDQYNYNEKVCDIESLIKGSDSEFDEENSDTLGNPYLRWEANFSNVWKPYLEEVNIEE